MTSLSASPATSWLALSAVWLSRAEVSSSNWRRLTRMAALGRLDLAEVEALQAQDPDPEAWVRSMVVRAAQPDSAAKEQAWQAMRSGTAVPLGNSQDLAISFWQSAHAEVLVPFADRYLDVLADLGTGGMIAAMVAADCLFPRVGVDGAYLDRLSEVASGPGISPVVLRTVVERSDEQRRMLAARRLAAQSVA